MELTHYNLDACNALFFLRRKRLISWRAVGLGTAIASFANKDTGEAWPSRATLEQITGIESRDIPRVTHELVEAGFMAIQKRHGHSNIYCLAYGEIAACGDLAAMGKQPPTCGEIAEKGVGKQPPITMKEQYKNNEVCTEQPKPLSRPVPPGNQEAPEATKVTPKKQKVMIADIGFVVPDAIRQTWTTAYPGVDIDREAAKAFAWCQNNPRRAPKKDFGRFLNTWLGRAEPAKSGHQFSAKGDLLDLVHRLDQVEAQHGEDIARQYDAKARELGTTAAADEWLREELLCQRV